MTQTVSLLSNDMIAVAARNAKLQTKYPFLKTVARPIKACCGSKKAREQAKRRQEFNTIKKFITRLPATDFGEFKAFWKIRGALKITYTEHDKTIEVVR